MVCEICAKKPIIGYHYRLQAGSCDCGHRFSGVDNSTYKGLFDNRHIFRLHPFKTCPVCGITLRYAAYRCMNMLDVTEEFRAVRVGTSHWVGEGE